jgi:hypothetical protein
MRGLPFLAAVFGSGGYGCDTWVALHNATADKSVLLVKNKCARCHIGVAHPLMRLGATTSFDRREIESLERTLVFRKTQFPL